MSLQVIQRAEEVVVIQKQLVQSLKDAPHSVDVNIPGLPGPPGTADLHFRYVQGPAAQVWTVIHNLGKRPSVTVVDSAGTHVFGEIKYDQIDPLNKLTVTFTSPFSGEVDCN